LLVNHLRTNAKVFHADESYYLDSLPFIPTGEILFKVKSGISEFQLLNVLNLGAILKKSEVATFDISVYQVKNRKAVFDIANKIYESGLVEWCHPNFFIPIETFTNDPLFSQQYYLKNSGQNGGAAGIDINVEGAWQLSKGANIRVAVIDEGVEDHEDLVGRVGSGFSPRDVNGNGRPTASGFHGEATAGIIAATQDNGIGITGVAPQCQIVPVNIFVGGETALDLANAINWAWNQGQADILSNSWGYNSSSQNGVNFDAIIQAITNARTQGRNGKGSLVVFSAGNNYGAVNDVSFPGNVDGVITVGACTTAAPAGDIWGYSQRGASMDLVAPSGNVNLNGDVVTLDRMGSTGYEVGNYTQRFGGTSAACPEVSGVAALALSANPALTESQLSALLRSTATDMGSPGFDNTFGYGRLNGCAVVSQAISSASINGSQNLCAGSTQYFISGITPSAINWTSSNPNVAVVTSNGNPVTLSRVGNNSGIITLSATISTGCANLVFSKQVAVGVPVPELDASVAPPGLPTNAEFFASQIPNATYSWFVSGISGNPQQSSSSNTFTWYFPCRVTRSVYCTATTTCGTATSNSVTVTGECIRTGANFTLSPNPAVNSVTVSATNTNKSSSSFAKIDQIKIFDQQGNPKKVYKFGRVESVNVDVSMLNAGVYYVEISYGTEKEILNLLIQK
jgi:serine protease